MGSGARLPLLVLVAVVELLLAWNRGRWAAPQLRIDACLDAGGRWDWVRERCSDVQADCRTSP